MSETIPWVFQKHYEHITLYENEKAGGEDFPEWCGEPRQNNLKLKSWNAIHTWQGGSHIEKVPYPRNIWKIWEQLIHNTPVYLLLDGGDEYCTGQHWSGDRSNQGSPIICNPFNSKRKYSPYNSWIVEMKGQTLNLSLVTHHSILTCIECRD